MTMTPQDEKNIGANERVDLSNCDREPINLLGRVQSFGALIAVSADWIVQHASVNLIDFIGVEAKDSIGLNLTEIISNEAVHEIRARLQVLGGQDAVERLFGVVLRDGGDAFDLAVHKSGGSIIIELERVGEGNLAKTLSTVRPMIERIGRSPSVASMCDVTVRQVRMLTRFDRVMIYQFNEDGSGSVVAEAAAPGIESYLGLRYPASDIPKQARELYKRNLLRIISDVSDEGCAIIPPASPEGTILDLSLSTTRAVSPIHVEYLKNMGVEASMSISIIFQDRLWGLIACHHYKPRVLDYGLRSSLEMFGQMFGLVLQQKENASERGQRERARQIHDQLMARMAGGERLWDNFDAIVDAIEGVIAFDGVVGWIDGQFVARGSTPTQTEFMALARFLNTTAASRVFSTQSISAIFPPALDYAERAAGLLALPVSRAPRDYIVLFRHEVAKSVRWAGNPEKPASLGPNGARLTPRKSFEEWRELVRNHCAAWTPVEVDAAEALRITLLEVVLRMADVTIRERVQSQQRQEILIGELNHRVRNILNLIRSLITQSKAESKSVSEFTETVGGRIHALARAHDQITQQSWAPASVYTLLRTEMEAYLGSRSSRIQISGPDAMVTPAAFTTLSLVFHELVTNSAKYGALADSRGVVEVSLAETSDGSLAIGWREIGGPPIASPPARRGFGSTIIERTIPFELKGTAEVNFLTSGLEAKFRVAADHISAYGGSPDHQPPIVEKTELVKPLSGDVLLVEDNMMIALDAEECCLALGAQRVHVAAGVVDALEIIEKADLTFALLDVNLGAETSEMAARRLQERSVPFIFASGYGDRSSVLANFPTVEAIQKPYELKTLGAAAARALESTPR